MVSPAPQDNHDELTEERVQRLGPGVVLVSRENLKDPNFDATVVLICVYNKEGAYGLVLNRPSHMPLSEMFDGFNGVDRRKKIYVGGPVRQEELQILQITDSPAGESHRVCERVHLGGHWENIDPLLEKDDRSTRIFLGYSGWGPGQLEFEIRAGAWEVFLLDVSRLLIGPDEPMIGTVETIERYLKTLRTDT